MVITMSSCSTTYDVLRTYILLELYIVTIIATILGSIYVISVIPIRLDALRILILSSILLIVVFAWYKITVKLIRYRLRLLK
jgi:hypothetical protein